MSRQNIPQAVGVFDPVQSGLGVELGREALIEKGIGLEAARGHEQKDAKRSVGYSKAGWFLFGQVSNQQVALFDIVLAVHVREEFGGFSVACHVEPILVGFEQEITTELIESGDATFAVAINIESGEIDAVFQVSAIVGCTE